MARCVRAKQAASTDDPDVDRAREICTPGSVRGAARVLTGEEPSLPRPSKPETFNFLGFTHISGRSRAGSFQLKRKTRRDRMRAKLRAIKKELRRRMQDARADPRAGSMV